MKLTIARSVTSTTGHAFDLNFNHLLSADQIHRFEFSGSGATTALREPSINQLTTYFYCSTLRQKMNKVWSLKKGRGLRKNPGSQK